MWYIITISLNGAICFLVDYIPTRCPEIAVGSWTRLSNYVWGMINHLVSIIRVKFHIKMKTVSFSGCLEYAKRGRHCILLLWSWTFPHWHSSLHCCELLHFWLVSSSEPPYALTFAWNLRIHINSFFCFSFLFFFFFFHTDWRSLCQRKFKRELKHLY